MKERHDHLLDPPGSAMVVVDLQEAFRPAIHQFDQVVARTLIMIRAAKLLDIPILVVEQYPERLGPTVPEVRNVLPASVVALAKSAFSACGAAGFFESLVQTGRRQVLLCGIETHVCVSQSAHDLLAAEFQVHILHDCTSSRSVSDREVGLAKMHRSGALPASSETALFELLRHAKHQHFKAVQAMIR